MNLTIERNRMGIADLLKLRDRDSLNIHFQLEDGDIVSFTDVPCGVLLSALDSALSQDNRMNGHRVDLFSDEDDEHSQEEID